MPISKETLDFLVQNKMHNRRTWYLEHKKQYQEYVLDPLVELVEKLAPTLKQIDPQIVVEPKVDKTISRIYRDTRFSKDKTLYREKMWIVFMKNKKESYAPPGFFLEFSPDEFRYGCGYYQAPPKVMEAVRELVLQNHQSFIRAQTAFSKQDVFVLEGDCYKRSKFPELPKNLKQWLDRKNLDFVCNSKDFELLFSQHLCEVLASGFLLLKPIYEFLSFAEARVRIDK